MLSGPPRDQTRQEHSDPLPGRTPIAYPVPGRFYPGKGWTLGTAFRHTATPFIGHRRVAHVGTLAIQTEIGYNVTMVMLQSIVVVTLVSVLYLYLRQSNQD
jgi:hypothetical protein